MSLASEKQTKEILVRLKYFRKKIIKKNQTELAEEFELSRDQYKRMESGTANLLFDRIMILFESYRLNPVWLWNGTPPIQFRREDMRNKKAVELTPEPPEMFLNDIY